jgi:outer membrane murein-binding lipoprotein Lpp
VMSFYERTEALVYVGAVVLGSALVAGAWFLVNGG